MDTIMFSEIIRRKRHLTNLFYNESRGLKLTNAAANATKAQQIRHHMAIILDLLNPLDWILWGDSQNSGKNYYDTKIQMYSYVLLGGDNMQDISFRMINQL